MKRMKKKVVAMVTLAMFMMTLLPMAAFAADRSYVEIEKSEQSIALSDNDTATVKVNVAAVDANKNVFVWLTDEDGDVYTYAEATPKSTKFVGAAVIRNATEGEHDVTFKFDEAGTYTVHAGVDLDKATTVTSPSDIERIIDVDGENGEPTIAVEAAAVDGMVVGDENAIDKEVVNGELDLTGEAGYVVYANNTASKTIKVKATANNVSVAGAEFDVSTSNSNLVLAPTGTVKTDKQGIIELTYSAKKAGEYVINISNDDYTAKIKVKATDKSETYPATIEASLTDSAAANIEDVKQAADLSDYVQFTIKDQNGVELNSQEAIEDEPAADGTAKDNNKKPYVKLVESPDKYKGEATDFSLMYDAEDEVYTLKLKNANKLVKGTYTVRVALFETGNYADVTFTVDKFDENSVVDMKVEPSVDRVAYDKGEFTYKVILVDKNGVEKNVTGQSGEYYMGIDSVDAVDTEFATVDNTSGVKFTVKAENKEAAIGSVITLTTVSDKYEKTIQTEVTVTDKNVVEGLAFDKDNGAANENNTVKVSVVDKDGEVMKSINGTVKAYIAKSSDETATATVDAGVNVVNGKNGTLTVYADKATTLDIVVAVVDSDKVYADTLTYTVGEQDIPADTSVVMTLGSTEMLVNNNIVDMKDAAPFAQDNRTFVPFRALGEALGAEVEYDKDAKTVTYNLGNTEIVMTLDSKTYTVNGAEKTMDVAPFAKDNRTYVPVRFVGEALGFKVTGLQDGNGKYVAVAFTK